jgi:hypothetical protein
MQPIKNFLSGIFLLAGQQGYFEGANPTHQNQSCDLGRSQEDGAALVNGNGHTCETAPQIQTRLNTMNMATAG